ncbi:YgaP-like transmembrane domain [Leucothrix arctica]|uniref:Inner membrane protein YgaP-like transmembrane domain-containing protein n=1 Tax=Leucothrix arctica TaxID=1481894 RepID=A0A317CBD5_9GAMM|nr:hypothetical protein DKT75_11585 [Leucothrix arctica]
MLVVTTQTQIANEIGTAREVVGRKLHALELGNVILIVTAFMNFCPVYKLFNFNTRTKK